MGWDEPGWQRLVRHADPLINANSCSGGARMPLRPGFLPAGRRDRPSCYLPGAPHWCGARVLWHSLRGRLERAAGPGRRRLPGLDRLPGADRGDAVLLPG